ncbi:flagellar protein FlaG [Sutcliffiella horikoshii]|uniref:flagellar protein FlaG n=1 Tax=Sutcliffiella horikoshii TaxID=79883 RepID=UPI001CFE4F9B|nr:flagellar protein FlaG [Sutcliffiella horikoshii]
MEINNTGSFVENTTKIQNQKAISHEVKKSLQRTKENLPELSEERMEEIVEGLNKFVNPVNVSVRFELHERLEEYYVKVVDIATDEVLREIPSKKFLDMYAAMTEYMGLFVDKKI